MKFKLTITSGIHSPYNKIQSIDPLFRVSSCVAIVRVIGYVWR